MATTRSSESRLACPAPACLLARGEAADSAERHQRVAHRFDQRDARREGRGDMLHVLAVERSRSVRAEPSGWSTRSPVLTQVGFCVRRRSPLPHAFPGRIPGDQAGRILRRAVEHEKNLAAGTSAGKLSWEVTLGVVVLADRASAAVCRVARPRIRMGSVRSHPIMQNPPRQGAPPIRDRPVFRA